MRASILAAPAALVAAVSAQVNFSATPTCVKGLQVITTCGTYQSGFGTLQGLTDEVVSMYPDSAAVAVQYPANTSPYFLSVAKGVANLTQYIQYFVDACPNVNLVLIGYSQGAQVTLSSLCGWPGGLFGFGSVNGLASKYLDRIIAVVGYGDPTHVYPNAIDRGNSTHDGEFPRPSAACDPISSKIASWCTAGDQFCDNCKPPINNSVPNPRGCNASIHTNYWNVYNPDAVAWVQQRWVETDNGTNTTIPSTTVPGNMVATASGSATPTSGAVRLQAPWIFRAALLRAQRG